MDRQAKDDEEREHELLQEQIQRATQLAEERGVEPPSEVTELKRDEGKIKLNLSLKPSLPTSETTTPTITMKKPGGNKLKMMMGGMKKHAAPSTQSPTSLSEKKPGSTMMMMGLGKRKQSPENSDGPPLDKKIKSH